MSLVLNFKFLSLRIYLSIVLFDLGFYCDIFNNIPATFLVFIVVIVLIVLTVQCCGNVLFYFFFETMVSYEYKSKQMIDTILVYCKRFVDNFKVYGETITPA